MPDKPCKAGLRVDVDTLRGTRMGVANLLALFRRYDIHASFFFSVGPDNMGRHLLRLLRPGFLAKMLRTGAPNMYGWDIFLKGTLWPGPVIGKRAADEIRKTREAGHEIGLHCWDHHRWQSRVETLGAEEITTTTDRGQKILEKITGRSVTCMAAPAWKITANALEDRSKRKLNYCADCRGHSIFYPRINGKTYHQPQIPTTLPTYDEVIGRRGISPENYNNHLLGLFRTDELNVLTIHAEAEGSYCFELFQEFLKMAEQRSLTFVPLGKLLAEEGKKIEVSPLVQSEIPGREGWVSCQG